MHQPDREWSIKYWSDHLTETSERAEPILKQMSLIPYGPLSTEDQFRIRELLMEYNSYVRLLAADVARPVPAPPPLWKKIFRKK